MQLRPETLEKYAILARNKLIEIARNRKTITYNELMEEIGGPGRGYIGQVLKEVCQREHQEGHPLLSALVVSFKDKHPGDGYWKAPLVLKSIGNSSKEQQLDFWEKKRQQVYQYWRKHYSYYEASKR